MKHLSRKLLLCALSLFLCLFLVACNGGNSGGGGEEAPPPSYGENIVSFEDIR